MENNNNTEKKLKLNKKMMIVSVLLIIVALLVIFVAGYARYVSQVKGTASAQTATMVCEISVESSKKDELIINPYCIVTVMDYKGEGKDEVVTETDVEYTLEVVPVDEDYILPKFEWLEWDEESAVYKPLADSQEIKNEEDKLIGRTAEFPTQTFEKGEKAEAKYKIIFYNTGEEEITDKKIKINLNAIQGMKE